MTLTATSGSVVHNTSQPLVATLTPTRNTLLAVAAWIDVANNDTIKVAETSTLAMTKSVDWIGVPATAAGTLDVWTAPVGVTRTFTMNVTSLTSPAGDKVGFPFYVSDTSGIIPVAGNVGTGLSSNSGTTTSRTVTSSAIGSLAFLLAFTATTPGAQSGQSILTSGTYGGEFWVLYQLTATSTSVGQTMTLTTTGAYNAIAFEIAPGKADVPHPAPRRRRFSFPRIQRARAAIVTPATTVVTPVRPTTSTLALHRVHGFLARRPDYITPVPLQPGVPMVPASVRPRSKALKASRPRISAPVPPQVIVPPAFVALPVRGRIKAVRQDRPRIASPAWVQDFVLQGQPGRSRLKLARVARGRQSVIVPDQVSVPLASRPRVKAVRSSRGHGVSPVPPQVIVPPAFLPLPMRARIKFARIAQPGIAQPVPPQQAPTPAFVPARVRQATVRAVTGRRGHTVSPIPNQDGPLALFRSRLRGLRAFRGSTRNVVPVQVVVPPAYPPQPVRSRLKVAKFWRSRSTQIVPTQVAATAPLYPPRMWRARTKFGVVARGQVAQPVPPQTLVAPAYVAQPPHLRVKALRISRGRGATPVPVQATPAAPAYPMQSRKVRGRGLRLFRGRLAAPIPVQAAPLPLVHAHYAVKQAVKRSPRLAVPPAVQTQPPMMTRIKLRLGRLARGTVRPVIPVAPVVPPAPKQFVRRKAVVGLRTHRLPTTGWMTRTVAPPRPGSMGSRTFTARLIDTTSASAMTTSSSAADLDVDTSGASLTSETDSGGMVNDP